MRTDTPKKLRPGLYRNYIEAIELAAEAWDALVRNDKELRSQGKNTGNGPKMFGGVQLNDIQARKKIYIASLGDLLKEV